MEAKKKLGKVVFEIDLQNQEDLRYNIGRAV
jgi:hypothetical protein